MAADERDKAERDDEAEIVPFPKRSAFLRVSAGTTEEEIERAIEEALASENVGLPEADALLQGSAETLDALAKAARSAKGGASPVDRSSAASGNTKRRSDPKR